MKNAKEEFENQVKNYGKPICAKIVKERNYSDNPNWLILEKGYSKKDYQDFLKLLNFDYDSGFGDQEIYGIILFENSYSDRREYDGGEWWENHKKPSVKDVMEFRIR